jgi:hypothetical protein
MAMMTLAGHRLEIRSPRRLEARAGSDLAIELDIELAEPWLERPRFGKETRTIDGHVPPSLAVAFESDKSQSVVALVSGTAQVQDTRIDVHTPAGFPDAGAGRGCELTIVAPSGFRVSYGHIARGSARTGLVRAGEVVAASGNTGRCVDGCGRTFCLVEIAGTRNARMLDDLFAPVEVELLLDGRTKGAVKLPAGETKLSSFAAGRVSVPRDQGKGACALEVRLKRRGSVIAKVADELVVHV